MKVHYFIKPLALLLLLTSKALADCAVLTYEESYRYYQEDLYNTVLKIVILFPTIVLGAAGAWRLVRLRLGWLAVVLLGVVSIPFLLAFVWVEVWNMECGFGGIEAYYYLVLLTCATVMFVLVRQYAEYLAKEPP